MIGAVVSNFPINELHNGSELFFGFLGVFDMSVNTALSNRNALIKWLKTD